ncbi:GTP 3',8-cyclase MoaA [Tumebacillus lipolyticus]|uniref:GTP 3',8-cyclase n=1 Tax=Tumebacillus lipolyticus TaxID=1280370 RepID=A0ABW4ZTJ8_9BACL
MLIDKFQRVHDYLRISVTDRCNLRCRYCMPAEGLPFLEPSHYLSFEQITEVVRVAAKLGVRRLRITGGEPLVRPNLERLIEQLSALPGIEDIALTTNAIYLAQRAQALKEAGITRVNISLDSLNPERFASITRGGDLSRVLDALERSFEVGFDPIKLNVVLMKGFNEDEIDDFLRLSIERPLTVRFIEYMPIGHEGEDWKGSYLPLQTVIDRCHQNGWEPVQLAQAIKGNGPAENFTIPGAKGAFGLIHPVSDHFCQSCNRLRLTADGSLKPCLYWEDEFNVKNALGDEQKLTELFLRSLDAKPETHEMAKALIGEEKSHNPTLRRMSQIGG